MLACRGDSAAANDTARDTLAPIGSGTELLLTRERLSLIDGWIRATIARTGSAPRSLDEVQPPEENASRYIPLERFLRDGWGREIIYEYVPATRSYELRSSGEDGALRTSDDVSLRARP
jgi:hypothetical protein